MDKFSDPVRDSRLETWFDRGCFVHERLQTEFGSSKRPVQRKEYWQRQKLIGTGAFGSVWLEKCVHGQAKAQFRAVKQIRVSGLHDPRPKGFRRELEAFAKFSHEKYERCFVKSFGWFEQDDALLIAMEYLELGDLDQYLRNVPPLPESEVGYIISQVIEGLNHMHENDFTHRDLKPGNILIKSGPPQEWWVKITDFGISKRIEDQSHPVSAGLRGTLGFIAPELYGFVKRDTDKAADMWSLGEITFQMMTKRPTFRNQDLLNKYVQQMHPFPLRALQSHSVNNGAQDFIKCTMARIPGERLTAKQALDHSWIQQHLPRLSVSDTEPEDIGILPPVDSLSEQLGAWTTYEGSTNRIPAHQESRGSIMTTPIREDATIQQQVRQSSGTFPLPPGRSILQATSFAPPNWDSQAQLPHDPLQASTQTSNTQCSLDNRVDNVADQNRPRQIYSMAYSTNVTPPPYDPNSLLLSPSDLNALALHSLPGHGLSLPFFSKNPSRSSPISNKESALPTVSNDMLHSPPRTSMLGSSSTPPLSRTFSDEGVQYDGRSNSTSRETTRGRDQRKRSHRFSDAQEQNILDKQIMKGFKAARMVKNYFKAPKPRKEAWTHDTGYGARRPATTYDDYENYDRHHRNLALSYENRGYSFPGSVGPLMDPRDGQICRPSEPSEPRGSLEMDNSRHSIDAGDGSNSRVLLPRRRPGAPHHRRLSDFDAPNMGRKASFSLAPERSSYHDRRSPHPRSHSRIERDFEQGREQGYRGRHSDERSPSKLVLILTALAFIIRAGK